MEAHMKSYMLQRIADHVVANATNDNLIMGQSLIDLLSGDDDAAFWAAYYNAIGKHSSDAEADAFSAQCEGELLAEMFADYINECEVMAEPEISATAAH